MLPHPFYPLYRPVLPALLCCAGLWFPLSTPTACAQADYVAPPLNPAADLRHTDYPLPTGDNVRFAAPDGSPDAPGTDPAAPTTAARAVALAPAGGTVIFRGGEYRGVSVDLRKPLTLQAYPREKPWFKGSNLVPDWKPEPATPGEGENAKPLPAAWRRDGWNHPFPLNMGEEYLDKKFPLAGRREQMFVAGKPMRQVASREELAPGRFFYDEAARTLFLGEDPGDRPVEVTARARAFHIRATEEGDPSGTQLRGLGFVHHADYGILARASNLVIEDCAFLWNAVDGGNFGGINLTVRRCLFAANGRKGAGVTIISPREPTRDVVIEDCTFRHNNVEHFRGGWDASGIKITRMRNLTVRNCKFESNFGCNALWLDISVFDAVVTGCRFRDGGSSGVMVELCTRITLANNLFEGERNFGVSMWDSSNVRVLNNTFVRCRANVAIHDTARVNDPARADGKEFGIHGQNLDEARDGNTWTTHSLLIQNNLFADTFSGLTLDASNCTRATGGRYNGEPTATMITALDHNGYTTAAVAPPTAPTPASTEAAKPPEPNPAVRWSLGADAGECDRPYPTVAAFREAHPAYEAHAVFVEDAAALFVNPANRDFRLRPGSPAAGAGAPLPEDVAKLLGVAPGQPVDLGARLP